MKKFLLALLAILALFTLTACGKEEESSRRSSRKDRTEEKEKKKDKEKEEEEEKPEKEKEDNDDIYVDPDDDIIIDPDDYEGNDYSSNQDDEAAINSVLINCEGCVFAYYTEDKVLGDVLTDYTKDFRTIKDKYGKQRTRFMGHIIDDAGHIQRAFACGIANGKVYCLEGGKNDWATYEYNVSILKQVFPESECRYIAQGKTYVCEGNIHGDARANGYVSTFSDEACYVRGENVKFACYAHN